MHTPLDHEFVRAAARAADRSAAPLAAGPDEEPAGVAHRGLARRVKTLIAAYRSPDSALHGSGQAVAAAMTHLRALRATQTATGLFAGGDNVQSPPDSAFTVNDVCDAHVLAVGAGPELSEVTAALADIAGAATASLLPPRFAELRTHVYEQIQAAKRGTLPVQDRLTKSDTPPLR